MYDIGYLYCMLYVYEYESDSLLCMPTRAKRALRRSKNQRPVGGLNGLDGFGRADQISPGP